MTEAKEERRRWHRGHVDAIVTRLMAAIEVPSWGYRICGSYRRGHDMVGDADVVVLPFGVHQREQSVHEHLTHMNPRNLDNIGEYSGELYRVTTPEGLDVDVRFTESNFFGASMVFLTGPRLFNRCLSHIIRNRMVEIGELDPSVKVAFNPDGFVLLQRGVERLPEPLSLVLPDERSVFDAAGIPFLPPNRRESYFSPDDLAMFEAESALSGE